MIDDGWWIGTIVEGGDTRSDSSSEDDDNINEKNHFLSLRVRWDNGEFEQMSPWDLEPIEESSKDFTSLYMVYVNYVC